MWLHVAAVVAGAITVIVVTLDVFLTILHPDVEGQIAKRLQRATWRAVVAMAERWHTRRGALIALAGPSMIALTFAVWMALFILGFALVFWPYIDTYRTEPELGPLSFLDALYYAGVTITVLGYGDITPLHPTFKLLTFVASASGFALLTGIVAYLIEIVSSINDRNLFTARVHDETGAQGSGADLAVRSLRSEEIDDLRERYEQWASLTRDVADKLRRYALAALYYRSKDPISDVEPAFRAVAEAAIAGRLAGSDPRLARLRPAVEHLDVAITRLMLTVADQYLDARTRDALRAPAPDDDDRRAVESIAARLKEHTHVAIDDAVVSSEHVLMLAVRMRTFQAGLDRVTHWSVLRGAGREPGGATV